MEKIMENKGKVAAIILVLALLIGLAIGGYMWWKKQQPPQPPPLPPPPPVDPTKANVSWYSIHDHANNVNYVGQVYVYPSEGSYSDVSTREIAGYPKTADDYMKQNYTNTNCPYYYDYEGTASNFKNFLFLEVTDFGFSIAPVSEVPPYVANGTQLAIVLKDSSWTKVQ